MHIEFPKINSEKWPPDTTPIYFIELNVNKLIHQNIEEIFWIFPFPQL